MEPTGFSAIDTIRQRAHEVIVEAQNPHISPYSEWSSDDLRELLVQYQIPLRDSYNATHETLVRICDQVFGAEVAESEKDCRRQFSIEEITRMGMAARTIQKAFFRRQAWKKAREKFQDYNAVYDYLDDCDYEQGAHGDYDFDGIHGLSRQDSFRRHSMLRRINEQGDDYDEEIEVEWRKPSWNFAKKFEAASRPHRAGKQMAKYNWKKTTLGRHCFAGGCGEQLDLWDEGRTSEFSQFGSGITNYFKFLKWCCWVMFILSLLHAPVLVVNAYGANDLIGSSFNLATTTFGNLGSAEDVASVIIPGCDEMELPLNGCKVKKNDLAILYSFIDTAGTIFFILAWLWLRAFESKESRMLNRSTVTASDYTIRLKSVPADTTEKELAIHFAQVTGEAVAAVHLAFNNSKEIKQYIKRGRIMQQRYNCVQRIRYEKTMRGGQPGQRKRLRSLMRERESLTIAVRQNDERRSKINHERQDAIQAFVTFETETGFIEAMLKYNFNWFQRYCCCYPERLKFKGQRLLVEQAPEPSTIMWENLEYSTSSRYFRKFLTTSVAFLAVLLSIMLTFLARDFKDKVLQYASMPCPDKFFDLDTDYQLELVRSNIDLSHCYCSTLGIMDQWNMNLCHDHLVTWLASTSMSYGAGFVVVFMNFFFTWLLNVAGSFEKHQSLDNMEESNMVRVFLLKFVNSGCLVLLYGQKWLQRLVRIRFDDASDFNVDWYATGGTSVMIIMLLNIIAPHVGSLIAYLRHRAKIRRLERSLTKEKQTKDSHKIWHTQEKMNEFYRGPPFRLNYRYAQVLVTIYICWMYAISMPLMPMIGAFSCYLSYWVDKFLFCNFYRTPPRYSDRMGKKCTKLLGFLIVLHMIMSLWMMGGGQIFQGESLSGQQLGDIAASWRARLLKRHLFTIEATLVLFVSCIILSQFSSAFWSRVCDCLRCLTCRKGNRVKGLRNNMNTLQVDYTSARDREIIRGLSSYNILQNPKYQEAFAITQEFAATHNKVSSIRGYNTKEGDLTLA
ncbi:hypothetical protein ACHAWT_005249 [Skeletonema menzelii]